MTLQAVEPMTEAEARRITERIRSALDRVASGWADLAERVAEAYERRADLALGYGSWSEYAEAELRPSSAIAAEVRRELVGLLTAQGMSTRAIAPAVGVSDRRVRQIVEKVGSDFPPEPERINPITGEVVPAPTFQPTNVTDWTTEEVDDLMASDDAVVEAWEASTIPAPPKITGLDGKQYARPEPKPARRTALPDSFWRATFDLTKKVESIVRLCEDNRFTQNAEKVALANRSDLIRAIDALQRVVDQLPERNIS